MARNTNFIKMLILFIFILSVGLLLPYTLVLGKAGLIDPNISERISFYVDLVIGFALSSILLFSINFFWKKNDKLGDNIGILNIGERPGFAYFKRYTAVQLTLLFNIIFGILFFAASIIRPSTGLTGLRVLPQQFSALDSLALSSMIIPIAENLMATTAMGVMLLLLTFLFLKLNIGKENYRISSFFLVTIGMSIFGLLWHLTVYPNSDVAKIVVAIFWGLGAFLSLATGLWTVFWSLHLNNNFFIDFVRLIPSDTVRLVVGLTIALQIGLYVWFYRGRLLGDKKRTRGIIK